MSEQSISPEQEHQYLKSYGDLSVITGGILLIFGAIELLEGWFASMGVSSRVVLILAGLVFLSLVWKTGRITMQRTYWFSKQAWIGSFDDEFLNNVSLKAYKVGFFAVIVPCIAGMFGAFNNFPLPLEESFSCLLGGSLLAYGLTIQIGLRDEDE